MNEELQLSEKWRTFDEAVPGMCAVIHLGGLDGRWVYEGPTTGGGHWCRRAGAQEPLVFRLATWRSAQ